ncbi:MAG: TonB-dependent receptor [Gemmatimonadetes bacterium]|nr:TonB-dependent receptor [Gemmatimonadota bacterium]
MHRRRSMLLIASCALGHRALVAQERDTTRLVPVVVTATRTDHQHGRGVASTNVLDAQVLRAAGVSDVADALRALPGLHLVRSGGPGTQVSLFVRGAESDYVRVLVDGVPVNEPGGAIDLSAWTLDGLDRIEVVRGPASVLYGSDALAGVVQLFTRRATGRMQGTVRASGGTYDTRSVESSLGGGLASWNATVNAGRRQSAGIQPFNSGWWNEALAARASWTGGRSTLAVTAQQRRDETQVPTDGAGRVTDHNAFRRGRRATVGMDGTLRLTDRVRLHAGASALEGRGVTDDRPDGPADSVGLHTYLNRGSVRRRVVESRLELQPREELLAIVGAEWALEAQHSRDSSNFGGNPAFGAHRTTRAAWAQVAGGSDPLQFTMGARHDDNSVFGGFTTARVGVGARLGEGWRLRGSIGTSFKAPTFLEQFNTAFTTGNPNLTPERGRVAELGLVHALRSGLGEVSATAFRQRFANLIQYAYLETGPHFFNVARAASDGVELDGHLRLGAQWQLNAASTWLETEVLDAGLEEGAGAVFVNGERLLRRPAHTVTLGATVTPHSRLVVHATAVRIGDRTDRDFSTFPARPVRLAPWTRTDLALTWAATAPVRLLLRADNLGGARYVEAFGFPAPGRQLTVGAEWRFGASGALARE